jgi:hypothetical protein
MKKILYLFAAVTLMASCKNAATISEAKKDTAAMPYKAMYSSDIVFSDSMKNVRAVLQSMKDWEDNKLANAPAYFGDTVKMDFWNGSSMNMKRDSMVKMGQKMRDSLASSKITVWVYTNLHAKDKNEDWVNVWYTQIDTYKNGKVDSAEYEDDNLMKNGKIVYISDKRRTLKPHTK